MNIQEREEIEFGDGHTNELSRLLEVSRGENRPPKINKQYIGWLCSLGFYVVIDFVEQFCPHTDAPLGMGEYLELVTRNPEEVEHRVQYFEDYGMEYKVYPPEPQGGRLRK